MRGRHGPARHLDAGAGVRRRHVCCRGATLGGPHAQRCLVQLGPPGVGTAPAIHQVAASLDSLSRGVGVFDADRRLSNWNHCFQVLLYLPRATVREGTPYVAFHEHAVEGGVALEGDAGSIRHRPRHATRRRGPRSVARHYQHGYCRATQPDKSRHIDPVERSGHPDVGEQGVELGLPDSSRAASSLSYASTVAKPASRSRSATNILIRPSSSTSSILAARMSCRFPSSRSKTHHNGVSRVAVHGP